MASKRRQINFRVSEASEARLMRLVTRMRTALGIDVSMSDVIQAGLAELEKRYPVDVAPTETTTTPPKRKGKLS